MIKGLVQFLKSKTFIIQLLIFIVSFVLLCWLILTWMKSYTRHGETVDVPDFKGVKLAELDKFIEGKKVGYLVIDSIYDVKSPPGIVVRQEPEAAEKVKEDRTIYLYVTSILPPSIQMPKLVDRSMRQAAAMIATYGLKMDKPEYRPDQCANCVLEQWAKGKKIEPGATIPKGTVIHLVIGQGLSDEEVGVPCLIGMSRKEAASKLIESSLSLGAVIYDVPKDSSAAKVYRQTPSCGNETTINLGGAVNIFLSADKNKISSDTTENDDEDPFK
jgi:beta-lactam-binding protein with PASTA domain